MDLPITRYDFAGIVKNVSEAAISGYAAPSQGYDPNFGRVESSLNAYNMVSLEQKLASPDDVNGFQKNEPLLRSLTHTNQTGRSNHSFLRGDETQNRNKEDSIMSESGKFGFMK